MGGCYPNCHPANGSTPIHGAWVLAVIAILLIVLWIKR